MLVNLESVEVTRYVNGVISKRSPSEVIMVDVTDLLPVFKTGIGHLYPEFGTAESTQLFKLTMEIYFIIYIFNGGYIDEHYLDIFMSEVRNMKIGLDADDVYNIGVDNATMFDTCFNYILDYIPDRLDKKNLLPVRWEVIGDRLKLIVNYYQDLIEILYEDV